MTGHVNVGHPPPPVNANLEGASVDDFGALPTYEEVSNPNG